MARYTFFPDSTFYKANLHCHSTISDGRRTPEELKGLYKAHGYSVLCITDHEYLVDHQSLNDEDMLFLNGYEMAVKESDPIDLPQPRACHLNLYARDPEQTVQVCFDPRMLKPNMRHYPRPQSIPEQYEVIYSPEGINEIIRTANENGFLVAYNHPQWSLEDARSFTKYEGLFAVEVFNYGSYMLGHPEYNIQAYDAMLRSGRRLFCMAGDDNHNRDPETSPLCDSFGGWIMINAPRLTYADIIHSLENGRFYASTGVSVEELYVENGSIHIACSPCKRIAMTTLGRKAGIVCAEEGKMLSEAIFPISRDLGFVRFELTDAAGLKAYTQAYWTDALPDDVLAEG